MSLSAGQRRVAARIIGRGLRHHATRKELLAAIETGLVESNLSNPRGGSGTSVGWRQETASSYPNANRRDVGAAADRFFSEIAGKRGMRGTAGQLAQAVQRSAFPGRYDQRRGEAKAILRSVAPSDGSGGDGSPQDSLSVLLRQGTGTTAPTPPDLTAVNNFAQSLQPPSPPPLGSLSAPSFSAKAPMPAGAQPIPSAGPPQPPQSTLDDQLQAVSQIAGAQPQEQPQISLAGVVRGGGEMPVQGGKVKVASSANRAGVGIKPVVMSYLSDVAGRVHREITVGTGTNHNRMTVDGNVSDHWDGHAADIPVPVDSHRGDVIATAALEQAGVPRSRAQAMAHRGGLYTINHGGHRIQVIWKTNAGGNHHNHVHIGIR